MSGISSAAPRLILTVLAAGAATASLAAEDLGTPPFPNSLQREIVTKWLAANITLPKSAPQVFGVDSVVAILSNEAKPGERNIRQVKFREEALQANYVTLIGGRSINGSADVDCRAKAIKLTGLTIYAGSNLQGRDVSTLGPRTDWRVPVPDRVLSRVVSGACGTARPPTVIADAGRAATPAPAPTPPALPSPPQGPALKPAIEAPRAPAAAAPSPQAQAPVAAPSRPAVRAPAPAPAKPVAPPPKPAAPPVRAAAPPAPTPSPPAATAQSGVMAQIGAVSSQAVAGAEWDRAAKAFPAAFSGRSKAVVKIAANGTELYRVLVGGFGSKAEAQSFCSTLQAKGRACFVRN